MNLLLSSQSLVLYTGKDGGGNAFDMKRVSAFTGGRKTEMAMLCLFVRHSTQQGKGDINMWSADIENFFQTNEEEIVGFLVENDGHNVDAGQIKAWVDEINILHRQLNGLHDARVIFEYDIPRMGRRVDVVLLYRNLVFLLEFKCGEMIYQRAYYDQVYDYALDLKDFHAESRERIIVPIIIPTEADPVENTIDHSPFPYDGIVRPLRCNARNIREMIDRAAEQYSDVPGFDYLAWEHSAYMPTPTIIEAAIELYNGMNVEEIARRDAGEQDFTVTSDAIDHVIECSRANNRKSICFVTGVPGAGKTLVGLNTAARYLNAEDGTPATYLSGNGPLVDVLQEALARDRAARANEWGEMIRITDARREAAAFIQIIHRFRDYYLDNVDEIPPEHVIIFDEAQRAWTQEEMISSIHRRRGWNDFEYSEPGFLISTMDRHDDWAVIVCLVGGGQEINHGEAGIPEWFDSLRRFPGWDVYLSDDLNDSVYLRRYRTLEEMTRGLRTTYDNRLNLRTDMRTYRTVNFEAFIKALLDGERDKARELYAGIIDKYPILLTRDLETAKSWVRNRCLGTRRCGIMASSCAKRLRPEGIFVKTTKELNSRNWFLCERDDIRSSNYLEEVASEFSVQGLELDYSVVAWDADFRFVNGRWTYRKFSSTRWNAVNNEEDRIYMKNAYRVLLTRARLGMAIFVPKGNDNDPTRSPEIYDGTYEYLRSLGLPTEP